ncbi:hypothetical protein FDC58_14820 [Clostridium botulinum]|uniref:Uncharacterized protein n=1 Tax=Clostridium botulinum TaxID=1491 RepID=A0A0A0UXU2_CLOBO|nr:hypothetical protein [Clostridium botulinum]AIW54583.1 hypothetical protein [Clostridium botulinum]AIW54699.1 hypothetical protein [Clostridium botulinum]AIW54765.1 hypothetical protein [Clostridium botulinum]AIW54832.1 hypothetical protein [Clostridium botulinum]MBY7009295.1 hypothetical protein [Clostridium botulinum]
MNINKENLEILLSSLIANNINTYNKNPGIIKEFYWENLILDLNEERKYIEIYFKYWTKYTEKGQRCVYNYENDNFDIVDKEIEYIELTLSKNTETTIENINEIEEKTYINKNALYTIISILKQI